MAVDKLFIVDAALLASMLTAFCCRPDELKSGLAGLKSHRG